MSEYAKKRVVPVGRVNGAIISEEYELTSSSEEEFIDDQEYEKEFVQEEMKQYAQCRGQVSLVSTFYCKGSLKSQVLVSN